jgi:uncharacterized protein involved in response to NO
MQPATQKNEENRHPIPILGLAFRPFFLAAALFSLLAIGWWSWWWLMPSAWAPYGGPIWWHAHEMIFGFSAAVVVGFLLTAVQNWTGIPGIRGWPLALLFGLWLLGRVSIAFDLGLSAPLITAIDCSFLIVAALLMGRSVILAKRWRNLMFVPILLGLAGLNAMSHSQLNSQLLVSAVLLISLIVSIIGGRVIPMFTANGLARAGIHTTKAESLPWLEALSLLSLLLVVIASLVGFSELPKGASAGLLGLAALAHTLRFCRWGFWRCGSVPLLWSLHLAYAFLPLGLWLLCLQQMGQQAGWVNGGSAPLHALTVGTIGGVILAMMTRVSLGHTGQPLEARKVMSLAFTAILIAASLRALLPLLLPDHTQLAIALAGGAWLLAYGLFVVCYAPLLFTPRADGKPG